MSLRWRAALGLALAAAVSGGLLLASAYWLVDGPLRTSLGASAAQGALAELRGELALVGIAWVLAAGAAGWAAADAVARRLRHLAKRLGAVAAAGDLPAPGDHAQAASSRGDELRDLAETLDAMLARLGSAFGAQRRYVAQAAHELRRPLTVIRTEVDVTLADPDASVDDLRGMGEVAAEAVDRCDALVASLLTLARGEGAAVGDEPADLARAVRTALGDAGPDVARRRLAVTSDLSPAPVRGDRRLLERLAANLVENAVVHNRHAGAVQVATGAAGDEAWLRVAADGPALDPEATEALLAPFARGPGAGEGTGLGLSIVRAVARAHGGDVVLRARPGGGLEAEVRLPARRGAGTAASPSQARGVDAPTSAG